MLSFFLILIVAYNLYVGVRRGVILEGIYTLGYLVTLIFARLFYRPLSQKLTLFIPYPSASDQSYFAFFSKEVGLDLDDAFYRGCAFLLILFLGWVLLHLLMIFLSNLSYLEVNETLNWAGGLALAFVVSYLGLFFVFYLLSLVPIDGLQHSLGQSWLVRLLLRGTPILPQWLAHLWIG